MSDHTDKADAPRRVFLFVQVCFIGYVIAEVVVAEIARLRATENTSSVGMKGDTALTASWPFTLTWAILVLLALVLKKPIGRGLLGLLATVYAISITAGNSSTVFARTQQFTAWKWSLVVSLDAIAAVFTVLCVVAAARWGWCALKARDAGTTDASTGARLDSC